MFLHDGAAGEYRVTFTLNAAERVSDRSEKGPCIFSDSLVLTQNVFVQADVNSFCVRARSMLHEETNQEIPEFLRRLFVGCKPFSW